MRERCAVTVRRACTHPREMLVLPLRSECGEGYAFVPAQDRKLAAADFMEPLVQNGLGLLRFGPTVSHRCRPSGP